jgi:hypothetical protein
MASLSSSPTGNAGAARSPRPRGRRSLGFGAAVLVGAAVIGASGGAGAAGLLTGKNVRDDSLRSADFRDGSISGSRVHDGGLSQKDVGFDLTGDQGAQGIDGLPGLPGIGKITYRTGEPKSSPDLGLLTVVANCDAHELALSGGAQLDSADPGVLPYFVASSGAAVTSWRTDIIAPAGNKQYTPWVVCARVP